MFFHLPFSVFFIDFAEENEDPEDQTAPASDSVPTAAPKRKPANFDDIYKKLREMQAEKHTLDVIHGVLKDKVIKQMALQILVCAKKRSKLFVWFTLCVGWVWEVMVHWG